MDEKHGMICSAAMELFHRVLDGDLMEARERRRMDAHLEACPACAEKAAQLREMQDLLRAMAERPMPDDAIDDVRDRTVRAPKTRTRPRWLDWRFAAAAAVVVFATWVGVQVWDPPQRGLVPQATTEPSVDPEQAAQEVRMVLRLAANAIRKSEEVAFREVFAEEVSPALEKVGILWPSTTRKPNADEGSI